MPEFTPKPWGRTPSGSLAILKDTGARWLRECPNFGPVAPAEDTRALRISFSNLQAGFELYLQFSVERRAIDGERRHELSDRCWTSLCGIAAAQAKHQAATEPTERYLSLLHACLVSGQAHLAPFQGNEPDRNLLPCGWRVEGTGRLVPQGRCVGWFDGDNIYLEPTAAFQVVQRACGETSESLPVTEQTLRKRLNERGVLASIDKGRETLTIRKTVAGSSKSILHLRRSTLLPAGSDDHEISNGGE